MDISAVFKQFDSLNEFKDITDSFNYFFKEYEMAMIELKSDIEIIDLEWYAKYGYSPFEHIKTRMKSPLSLRNKIERKGIPFTTTAIRETINDIIGLRIVTSFEDDVYKIYELIANRSDLRIKRVKDYIKYPKASGYKSLHVIVEVELVLSEGHVWIPAEIQIRTLAMDFFASLEHKLQYKYNTKQLTSEMRRELYDVAQASSMLDEKMSHVRDNLMGEKPIEINMDYLN